uniref:Fibroblast growth factor n=1 Tax=Timema douglasi TaxID=61478 RepID=A0A7R8VQF5_TIMDO|nr:unnamed protein product [Timema douglasi]
MRTLRICEGSQGVGSYVICKGPSTSSLRTWANAGVYLDPARAGNPVFGSRMQLYCRTGYHLSILHSGKVLGSEQDFNKFAVVELSSVDIGEVRIRGVETNLYLSMNNNGRLYGEGNVNHEGTIFIEDMDDGYSSYRSKEHEGWYIGINKAGKIKLATKTKKGQSATKFLPRREGI